MAKAKNENEEDKKEKVKKKVSMSIPIGDILNSTRHIIGLSPRLDLALGGGVPDGIFGIISGKPKLGKSTLALTLASNAQKVGKKVYYFDIEARLQKKNLLGIEGLDLSPEKFEVIRSSQNNIYSAEQFLDKAEDLLKTEPNIVVILDSSSSLCSTAEQESEITSQFRNPGAKLLSTFTRKLASVVPVQNSIVIIIQHLIANTSGYGAAFMEDGGTKIVYQSDLKLRGKTFVPWKDGETNVGQIISWDIVCAPLGAPGATVESYLRYGFGVDHFQENCEIAVDVGLIMKGGAWFTLDYLDDKPKLQGQHKLREFMMENPDKYDLLKTKIKEVLE